MIKKIILISTLLILLCSCNKNDNNIKNETNPNQTTANETIKNKGTITDLGKETLEKYKIDVDEIGLDYRIVTGFENNIQIYLNEKLTDETKAENMKKIVKYLINTADNKQATDYYNGQEFDIGTIISKMTSVSIVINKNGKKIHYDIFESEDMEYEQGVKNDCYTIVVYD